MNSLRQGKQIREQLQCFGSDITKAHPIDFYFYLTDEGPAYLLAAELQRKQFSVTVEESGADSWLCLARKNLVPTDESLDTLYEWFEHLSNLYEAEFDGWESEILF